jgi:hypothetical protein
VWWAASGLIGWLSSGQLAEKTTTVRLFDSCGAHRLGTEPVHTRFIEHLPGKPQHSESKT